jgi:hypothetical protein
MKNWIILPVSLALLLVLACEEQGSSNTPAIAIAEGQPQAASLQASSLAGDEVAAAPEGKPRLRAKNEEGAAVADELEGQEQPGKEEQPGREEQPGKGESPDRTKRTCPKGGCSMECPPGRTCVATCSGGNCTQSCGEEARCDYKCSGGRCTQTCNSEARCRFTCSKGHCKQKCAEDATCLFTCTGGSCERL